MALWLGVVACAPPASPSAPAEAPGAHACTASRAAPSPFALTVLGSGGPRSFGRAASSYVVSVDGVPHVLVDAGPGAFVRLGETQLDFERLDTVLLTHLHVDHAGDLPGFVKSRDLTYDRALTFRIFGPEGGGAYPSTRAFVEGLFGAHGAFAYLPGFRNELTLDVHDLPTRADAPIQEILRDPELRVTSIAVDHGDTPAVAYRIEHGGHAIVISGDLASKNDNLVRLAAGADVLVYDTAVLDPPGSSPGLYALHTPPRRIGEVAAAAHVRSLVLSHLPPAVLRAQGEVLAAIRAGYGGPVRFASDCMRVEVPTP